MRADRHGHLWRTVGMTLAPLRGKALGFIGAGTMGQALMKGLLVQGISARALRASDANGATRREVSRRFGVDVRADNAAVARRSDIVILAVKPQQFQEIVLQLAPHVTRRQLVITIAAGITLRWLQRRLPGVPVIRVMPNLPATIGSAFSAIAPGRAATTQHRAMAKALFGAVGQVAELPERYFDAITAVSGSGPAYVFFLVHMWEEAARSLGLPPAVASGAVRQTLEGSMRLLQASRLSASELIGKVASKRGTTEAALKVLAKRRVAAHFAEALRAAARRSRALSWS